MARKTDIALDELAKQLIGAGGKGRHYTELVDYYGVSAPTMFKTLKLVGAHQGDVPGFWVLFTYTPAKAVAKPQP